MKRQGKGRALEICRPTAVPAKQEVNKQAECEEENNQNMNTVLNGTEMKNLHSTQAS